MKMTLYSVLFTLVLAASFFSTMAAPVKKARSDNKHYYYPGDDRLLKDTGTYQKTDTIVKPVNASQPVQLAYTTSPQNLTTASTDAVYSKDLLKYPVTSFRNALAGRIAGLYALQSTGLPGSDGAFLSLRGQSPIIIVDGVVTNITMYDLEEIESVTVLKDAVATAMLGARGNNGAIVITTKKGKEGRQEISFTAQTAIQQAIGYPKTLNAYDYARLHNEALRNDGIDSAFSGLYYNQAALNAYQTHSDPILYPDVNYKDAVTNNSSLMNKYTLSATGGNRFAKYFISLEHVNQTGFLKTADSNSYNTNNTFKSYVIRSNIDVNITPKLTGGIYLLGRIMNGNEPGAYVGNIISNILNTPANSYPLLNNDGSFAGSQLYQNNVLAQAISSGYRQNYKRDILVNMYLKRSLDELLPGLYTQFKAAFNSSLSENIDRSKSFAVFQQNGTAYTQFGTNGTQNNGNGVDDQGRSNYEEFSLGYDRVFKNAHGINAIVLVNRDNSFDGYNLPYTISGASGRLAYNFNRKYIVEGTFGYNGSNRYPANGATKRGFFPALGLGWNIDQENFMKAASFVSRLKLYASYGKTGWDNPGYFVYYPRFFDGPSYYLGTSAGSVTTITEGPFANPDITFEKATKLNVGVNGELLNNHVGFKFEYFKNKFSDLLMQRGANSTTIGQSYPDENIGKNQYSGVEGQLSYQQNTGKLQYFVSANASTVASKILYMDEVNYPYAWMYHTGQPVGQRYGYIAQGLFQSQAEINSSAVPVGYKAQPGDIKYKDLNNDGVINQNDITAIGTTKPLYFYGVSLGLSWKGFDISALLQGVGNRNLYLSGSSYWAFQNGGTGQAYDENLNRWTPATAASATYPRLSYGTNTNNQASSSYWFKNGNYVRLRNAEIGYSLPETLTRKARLKSVRVFANGYNLLTFASSDLDGRDPEAYTGGYPVQRLFNFGINIKL
jgi:TonB-linked SusC/RagA family outer membrane protein